MTLTGCNLLVECMNEQKRQFILNKVKSREIVREQTTAGAAAVARLLVGDRWMEQERRVTLLLSDRRVY